MKINRSARAIALLAAASFALTACSSGDDSAAPEDGASAAPADLKVWFMDGSVPDDAQAWLKTEFEKEHEGSTLTIEIQQWDGIVEKIQTAMTSESQTPDIVEVGNTQSPTYTAVGAFSELTDEVDALGGDDLIQSFIAAGSVGDKAYTLPFYGGSRIFYYDKDTFAKAGVEVPTSLDEFNEVAKTLTEKNPNKVDGFKGAYIAGVDQHTLEGWLYTHGGQYAVQDGDEWVGNLESPESQEALEQVSDLFAGSVLGAEDSVAAAQEPWNDFNEGSVAMFSGLTWAEPNISADIDYGVFALPGIEAGTLGKTFAGGSNIGIAAKSKNQALANDVLELLFSEDFQVMMAQNGWVPGNTTYADAQGTAPNAKLLADVAANSQLTPAAQNWALVEGANLDKDFWKAIATGADPAATAKEYDAKMVELLNKK
ncbi:carbohydrate ABC transporter substrate-binding protein (CUT1 family) [Sediminihabitans luteus]|uniref:Carbohydrate ABC transporter substrate-binding protein (CUT1 family) n=1 Tax=Sediminihabitans luteus TaxID=1138585 RepID=A0A2M9CZJ0_9CELL|nr:extracellular solute-binding protein [Sediminihabitans luteus]PJJ77158.1 carbohydrate ABC transporter substrate-binding protein (CUT1 family) [Sediminihabitans luteus]GII98606.1 sugar ABC transporter substrate-binding protein [Sediminihabitans luteus]